MQLSRLILLLAAGASQAAASWSFDDASVTVVGKGANAVREQLGAKSPLSTPVKLSSADTLKIILTAKDGGKAKRPHQAFVLLKDATTGLEAPFVLTVKENGKAVVSIPHKDIPLQLLASKNPVQASAVISSFGLSPGIVEPLFDIQLVRDSDKAVPELQAPVRYEKQPEIHHIFRPDPKSPPAIISLFFAAAVAVTVPALFVGWSLLGANLDHIQKALGAAPLSHATFFGSILSMEGMFFLYYSGWNLFRVLPLIGVVALAMFLSGTKALGEVQGRRLAGQR